MRLICLIAVVFSTASAGAQTEKTHLIKTQRPSRAGERIYEIIKADISESFRLMHGEDKLKEEVTNMHVELSGVREVQEVNAQGKARKLSFTIDEISPREGDKSPVQPFKPGTIIVSSRDDNGKQRFEADGVALTGAVAKALHDILKAAGDNDPKGYSDKLLGTDIPRAAGDEWSPDPAGFVEYFSGSSPIKVTKEGVKIKLRFDKVESVENVECCKLLTRATLTASPDKETPSRVKSEKNVFTISEEEWFPVNQILKAPKSKSDWLMEHSGIVERPEGEATFFGVRRMVKEIVRRAPK